MPHRIGVIISSVKNPRICPQIADFVTQSIQQAHSPSNEDFTLHKIDLAEWPLPLSSEPGIPQMIQNSEDYKQEHTRAWSRKIASYNAFIFVSPQYNCSYPAVLKNAIDYLFNEWSGKPAMIVTYGVHGGAMCAEQLRTVLEGVQMRLTAGTVELKFPSYEWTHQNAFVGADLGLDAKSEESLWAGEQVKIGGVFAELVKLVDGKTSIS